MDQKAALKRDMEEGAVIIPEAPKEAGQDREGAERSLGHPLVLQSTQQP